MLPYTLTGNGEPSLVLMHYLGGSRRTWSPTIACLDRLRGCLALDLPGFGEAEAIRGYTVADMADHVDATVLAAGIERCVLTGHSMSGKIALALAARKPLWLAGLILVAPSPPGPQPMSVEDRNEQRSFGKTRDEAQRFVDKSSGRRLPDERREVAIADAQRVNLKAWRAWVDGGSMEDWRETIPPLTCPALVVCGEDDSQVPGVDDQRRLTLPFLPNGHLEVIPRGGHLMPLQLPDELAQRMLTFTSGL